MRTPMRPRICTAASSRCRRSNASLTRSERSLERHLHAELRLPRVADALAQEAVEVEEAGRRQRVHVIRVVEGVEHLETRNDLSTSQLERTLEAPVEREVLVVLPIPVTSTIVIVQNTGRRRDRLRRAPLSADVQQKLIRQFGVGGDVELVPNVAIRWPVVLAQVVEVERSIRERVAFVRVILHIVGEAL